MDPISLSTLAALSLGAKGLGTVGNIIGGFQQAKAAKDALNFQKRQYMDWQNTRRQNEQALNEGFNVHFNEDGSVKGAGLLGQRKPRLNNMSGMNSVLTQF